MNNISQSNRHSLQDKNSTYVSIYRPPVTSLSCVFLMLQIVLVVLQYKYPLYYLPLQKYSCLSWLHSVTQRCVCDLRFPIDTGTPGWHHSSQGSRPPSWLHRRRSGCGHLDRHTDVDWLVSMAKQWPRTQTHITVKGYRKPLKSFWKMWFWSLASPVEHAIPSYGQQKAQFCFSASALKWVIFQ